MQPKCAPCTSSESTTTNPPNTTACPNPHQADREYFDHATTTTCQPKTAGEWSPCSNCENIDPTCDQDADCWITEDCDDHYYRSPKRSGRLFSPVFPTKAKPRRKRAQKAANTGKPTVSSGGLKEGKIKQDADQKASTTEGKSTVLKSSSSPKETARKTGGEEAATTSKSKSKSKSPQPKSPSSSPTAKRSPSKSISPEKCDYGTDEGSDCKSPKQKVFYLKRAKKKIIDWKKPPKIPIKHTATSKARNENWFADCGRYRIKAYRGDWNNLPAELTRDYEVFERFFKYRRPAKKNTSLVKKLVEGKIDLQKPRIDKKPFHKRSPVVPAAGEKPKRSSKLKSSQFELRGARVNLRKQPLIEVKHTLTSSLRRHLDAHSSCDKPQTPTYWHGSAEEIEQLKKKIDQRRGQLRNYWKNNGQQARNDSMNNLIIASTNPSIIVKTKTYRSRTRKSNNTAAKRRQLKGTPPQMLLQPQPKPQPKPQPRPHRAKQPSDNDIKIFQRAIAFKVLPLTKSIAVSGHGHGHGHARGLDKPPITSALPNDANDCGPADTAKWMLPPTIPIRYSLTSIMRQRSTNKPVHNTSKGSSNVLRVAR